jgi:tripartite-type tricarboxylate transporter receptor subunit TctC
MKKLLTAMVASLAMSLPAFAQYPNKPITMVVPFPAGGPTDTIARIVAEPMSKALGQQIVIENVSGAAGQTGAGRVAQASGDGYTILMGHMGTHAASVGLNPNLRYNPQTDFTPIGLAGATPIIVVSKKTIEAKNLKEFIDYAKAQGDKLTEAHAGVGSVAHTTCTLFAAQTGIKPTRVAYRGTAPILTDLLGGQVDFGCDQIVNVVEQIKAGGIKAYAVASDKRSPALPDLPTTTEAGLPSFKIEGWNAIFAPKNLPADVTAKLVDALDKALSDPAVSKRLSDLGAIVPSKTERTPAGLAAIVKRDIDALTPALKAAGVTMGN